MSRPKENKRRVVLHLDQDVAEQLDRIGNRRKGKYVSQLVRSFGSHNHLLHRIEDLLQVLEEGQTRDGKA